MLDYSIAAIPTVYRGRQYRSRLEARWAAFFDQVGWRYEYEPFDLGQWSPDFLLHGSRFPILVEIKPISTFDRDVGKKMSDAANAASFNGELLLLGINPMVSGYEQYPGDSILGWLDDRCWGDCGMGSDATPEFGEWGEAAFAFYSASPDQADFCHTTNSFSGRITGAYDGGHYGGAHYNDRAGIIERAWARATNAVQYRRGGAP